MDTNNISLLISGYIDGELTSEEASRLAEALNTDGAALDRLVSVGFIHSQLSHWMNQEHAADHSVTATVAEGDPPRSAQREPLTVGAQNSSNTWRTPNKAQLAPFAGMRPRLRSWAALAAGLLVAASAAVAYFAASRPVFVAQLTDATNCTWGASQSEIPVGAFLESDQELQLLKGRAVITFESGAKLLLEGPTSLRLDSPMQVRLIDGRIAAKVPRQAIGFTVTSSLARFIDLGTAFTLNLVADKSFELHVFEGLVELRLDQRFGTSAQHPARVAEVRAVSFDVKSGDIAYIQFQEGKQMPF